MIQRWPDTISSIVWRVERGRLGKHCRLQDTFTFTFTLCVANSSLLRRVTRPVFGNSTLDRSQANIPIYVTVLLYVQGRIGASFDRVFTTPETGTDSICAVDVILATNGHHCNYEKP